ncbi:MAG TPA: hypothetical protein VMX13_08310 [Sedimentisphaerales bacterium]|nr:hypothetical protein [Sedimentisphaerales bacterium]
MAKPDQTQFRNQPNPPPAGKRWILLEPATQQNSQTTNKAITTASSNGTPTHSAFREPCRKRNHIVHSIGVQTEAGVD